MGKRQPGPWAWRIGALGCGNRCRLPDTRTWMCGLGDHPRRCTHMTCKEFGHASAIASEGRKESVPTKSDGQILADEVNRRMGCESEDEILRRFWMENYTDDKSTLCVLCANTGFVDTTLTAVSAAGVRPGGRHPCICPNGRAIRAGLKKAKRVEIEG